MVCSDWAYTILGFLGSTNGILAFLGYGVPPTSGTYSHLSATYAKAWGMGGRDSWSAFSS